MFIVDLGRGHCPSSLLLSVFEIFYNKKLFFFFNVEGERMKKWKTVIIVGKHMEGGSLYDALWYMFENFHNENFEMF